MQASKQSVDTFLSAPDPLSKEAAEFLVRYEEEDDKVDYKLTLDPFSEKEWLEVTKDISAFANTYGGYLVFGVKDQTKSIIGLDRNVADTLLDVNNVQQKINRHLEPDMGTLRAKEFELKGKTIVVYYIPQSVNRTHMIGRDGTFTYPSGKEKTVLRQGTLYVRRNAGNHLGDSRDLEGLIERRIDQFREALLDKVAKVMRAPATSDVYILSKGQADEGAKKFVLQDSSDAQAVKGMSFTVAPENAEEEVIAWTTLSNGRSETLPPEVTLWRWYTDRESMVLTDKYRLMVFRFMLWHGVPHFYWIRGLTAQQIKECLFESVKNRPNNRHVEQMLVVAAFLGKGAYNKVLTLLGEYKKRLGVRLQTYPTAGPRSMFLEIGKPRGISNKEFRDEKLKELNAIVEVCNSQNRVPGGLERSKAIKIDRMLYAQDDQYK